MANTSASSRQIERATAELGQAWHTISAQSKGLEEIVHFKSSIKSVEDNVTFYEVNAEDLNGELAKATAESTGLEYSFNGKSS